MLLLNFAVSLKHTSTVALKPICETVSLCAEMNAENKSITMFCDISFEDEKKTENNFSYAQAAGSKTRKVNFDKEVLDKIDNELKMEGTELAVQNGKEIMLDIEKKTVTYQMYNVKHKK